MVVHLVGEVVLLLKPIHLVAGVVQSKERVGLVLKTQGAVQEASRVVAVARAFLSLVGGVEVHGIGSEASCSVGGEGEASVELGRHCLPPCVSVFLPGGAGRASLR